MQGALPWHARLPVADTVPWHAAPEALSIGVPRRDETIITRNRRTLGPFATIQKSSSDCGASSPSWSRLHSSCLHVQNMLQHSTIASRCIVCFHVMP